MSFTQKDYPIICHVCDKRSVLTTRFLSGAMQQLEDGSFANLHACSHHTGDEIRAAWNAWCNGTKKPPS